MDSPKTSLTAKIVAAYLGANKMAISDIPALIRTTYAALVGTGSPLPAPVETKAPAVTVKKSVTADHITCLDCGKKQKMLKRHLQTGHGLTIDEYRIKWSLSKDYPMVAPEYAARRSEMAKAIGLGYSRNKPSGKSHA